MEALDLTCANFCKEKNDIAKRNKQAKAYSNSIMSNKISKAKDLLLMFATIVCVNTTIVSVLADAFL